MGNETSDADTRQARWARFRFLIVGPLMAAPPAKGELQQAIAELAKKTWQHPITSLPVQIGASTIERWFYKAREVKDPVGILRTKRRADAGCAREMSTALKQALLQQYREHTGWSYQLHVDNLASLAKQLPEPENIPSYSTVRRYMKANGLTKRRTVKQRNTPGAILATERLEQREVRSYEVDYVNALWHLDFHHGSRNILDKQGQWRKPLLLAILDDRSRIICHAQWYFDETAETLVHGFMQALQKRALPRALMSDNGAAMVSAEFTQGLERLSILHQPTLPYSPYQNAKQEVLWAQVEGRLMAMLEGEPNLTLAQLNEATIAWVEFEYHRKHHSELNTTPIQRYMNDTSAGRDCPSSADLRLAFCMQVKRKQRKSDGTFSLDGKRFEIPSQYRHQEYVTVRYARWDLSHVTLVDPHTDTCLCKLYPQDKAANASGYRRALQQTENQTKEPLNRSSGIAPLLKDLMANYAATGLPPAFLPKED